MNAAHGNGRANPNRISAERPHWSRRPPASAALRLPGALAALIRRRCKARYAPHLTTVLEVTPTQKFYHHQPRSIDADASQVHQLTYLLNAIDVQVCFWKSRRPAEVPSRFPHSRAQRAQAPFPDAWQNTPTLCPLTLSAQQIPSSTCYGSPAVWSSSTSMQSDCSPANTTAADGP